MKSLAAISLFALLLAGCTTQEKPSDLQQEKLLLELMQSQRTQLADLMQQEKNLRALETKNEDTLADIQRQRAALEKRRQETAQNQKAAADALAAEKAALQRQREPLEAQQKAVLAQEARNQQTQRELAARRAALVRLTLSIEAERRLEPLKPEAARPGHEDQVKAEIAARVKQREPALGALAKLTADLFVSPLQREAALAELLDLLQRAKVAEYPGRRRLCRAGPRTRRVGIISTRSSTLTWPSSVKPSTRGASSICGTKP